MKSLPWEPTSLTYRAPPTLPGLGVSGLIKILYACKLDILPSDPYNRAEVKPFFSDGEAEVQRGEVTCLKSRSKLKRRTGLELPDLCLS